jgi:hypothetical protein
MRIDTYIAGIEVSANTANGRIVIGDLPSMNREAALELARFINLHLKPKKEKKHGTDKI